MTARVSVTGLETVQRLLDRLGDGAAAASEKAVRDAGLAAQRSLVSCYRGKGRGGRSIADSVTSPFVEKRGRDSTATVDIGHKWSELFEEGATLKTNPRRATDEGLKGIPMQKKTEGLVFRRTVGVPSSTYTIAGAKCVPGAIKKGTERLEKSLELQLQKLTGEQ